MVSKEEGIDSMIEPTIVNVVCPKCEKTWMNKDLEGVYFCVHCGYEMTEEEAKAEAWRSESPYYGE